MRPRFSLRTKFTLVLLFSNLLSLSAAGLIGRAILFHEFNDIAMQESFQQFHAEMTLYLETYGSWEKAQQKESFNAFEQRRRDLFNATLPGPRYGNFRFDLADATGKIIMGGDQLKAGTFISDELRKIAKPILLRGQTVALALPDSQINLNLLNLSYLQAMHRALLAAAFTAGLLSLILGLFIGSRVNGRLRRLTSAIKAMQEGNLRQNVQEYSHDEIGLLANAFNKMSSELAEAHDALSKSHHQIRSQAKQLKELSIRDELTGLFNRRYSDEQGAWLFDKAIRNSQPFTVAIADIDFFKEINDGYSHATGDEVLRRVADILEEHLREGDVLARYGGEEFVLIFPQTALLAAAALCEKLRKHIEDYPWHEVHPGLAVTMSFGLCGDTAQGSFQNQLAAADDELHEAKENGKNRICFDMQKLN